MNHDASHCNDYDPVSCPQSCYRAQLTEEYNSRDDMVGIPVSFISFYESGDPECPRSRPYVAPKLPKTNGALLRSMDNFQLAVLFSKWHFCPGGRKKLSRCKKVDFCDQCWTKFLDEVPADQTL